MLFCEHHALIAYSSMKIRAILQLQRYRKEMAPFKYRLHHQTK